MRNVQCKGPEAARVLLGLRTRKGVNSTKGGQHPKLATERVRLGIRVQPELLSQWLGIWAINFSEAP